MELTKKERTIKYGVYAAVLLLAVGQKQLFGGTSPEGDLL